MSGAGVAFPVRFFSVHFQCVVLHFVSKALLGSSSPEHCPALLLRCLATLFPSVAQRFFSEALQCISNPTRRRAVRFLFIAVRNISSPKHCSAYPIQRVAGASIAAAMQLTVYPSRCFTLRFLSDAFHCFALPHFAFAWRNSANALYCFSTPQPCPATQCSSTPVLHGVYPLGPLPAPISVLGEKLPDPALGIEREPICPGCGLAHDAPYILEVCLRCVGVPLDDYLVVDMEDHPVSGLLEVV